MKKVYETMTATQLEKYIKGNLDLLTCMSDPAMISQAAEQLIDLVDMLVFLYKEDLDYPIIAVPLITFV